MNKEELLKSILPKLNRGNAQDDKWPDWKGEFWALCPFHPDDKIGSFSVGERGYNCFSCGAEGSLKQLAEHLGVTSALLRVRGGGKKEGGRYTLDDYASQKKLPREFLSDLGVNDFSYMGETFVRMPYVNEIGQEVATRQRRASEANKFKWSHGAKLIPYGVWRLRGQSGPLYLVEGESDAQTLWSYGFNALGIPGANTWKDGWKEYCEGFEVHVWREPDQGGDTLAERVGKSLPEAKVLTPPQGRKDISEAHLLGEDVPALLEKLKAEAKPWLLIEAERKKKIGNEAYTKAQHLLHEPDILDLFDRGCANLGLVDEKLSSRLLYLSLTTRLLEKPVSLVAKGVSSSGKSFSVDTVLKFFPESAFYELSSMSERALAYSEEPLEHRFLIVMEAAGLESDFGSYLLRTLLSESRIRYETVEKTNDGLKARLIKREGPTGLIMSTTWTSIHPENETRMFSLLLKDDREQTFRVMSSLADRMNGKHSTEIDLDEWQALQTWLEISGDRKVSISYAHELAAKTNPAAVRLRRDFMAILSLIAAHAILYQEQRKRDEYGRIVATIDDYRAVYPLVVGIVTEGVEMAVHPTVRKTVESVRELAASTEREVTIAQLITILKLERTSVYRRVKAAVDVGYLVNNENRERQAMKLVIGDPMPDEVPVLPHPDELSLPLSYPPDARATAH
jgi:hypothetical protein